MMKSSFRFVAIVAALFSCYMNAQASVFTVDNTSPVAEDIPYRVALFYQQSGEYESALQALANVRRASASPVVKAYRDMLAANINVTLKRYEEAERLLGTLNDPQILSDYNAQVILPLAKVHYAKSRCDKVIETLARVPSFSADLNSQAMYLHVSCIVGRATDASIISQSEQEILNALMSKTDADNMWFAYAYYNVASVAAGQFKSYTDADRLFNEALKYVDKSSEGLALKERILLNLAYANYADNRLDYAAKAFAELPVDGIWADVALLGYGWASLNSYKPDMAIEAWRQLVNLPYKSAAVYEGYMAIPQAYEKATSYAEALAAYDDAIKEFVKLENEIDQLLKTLSRQKIREYALQYSQGDTTVENPLPPLLARTYTEDSLRNMVVVIGEVEVYRQRLAQYEKTLQQLKGKGGIQATNMQNDVLSLRQRCEKLLSTVEVQLVEQTQVVLNQQKKKIMLYTLDARITNARLQEEFFQRGGRRLWQ